MAESKKAEIEPDKTIVSGGFFDNRPRQFPFRKRIQIPLIAAAVSTAVRAAGPTLRMEQLGLDHLKPFFIAGQPCIFCFWHRGTIPILWFARGRPIAVLSSANFDGQWASRVGESMGLKSALGSSSRGGLGGFAELEKHLMNGWHAAMAVDGPRGPRYVAKPGPVYLAQRTGCPILGVHAFSERAITLEKSWDRLQIPLPFTRVAIVFTPPVRVPGDAAPEMIQRKYAEMQRHLETARDAAESWFKRSPAEQERDRTLLNDPERFGLAAQSEAG